MKYFFPGMACAAVAFSAALAGPVHAMPILKDTVVDARGNIVTGTNGACVRTRWETASDPCGAAPAPVRTTAPAAPAEAPKMVVREHKRSYLVFFDFDRSNLTGNAKQVLADVVAKTKGSKEASYEIVGHADRSGPATYNMKLSKKRAASVKSELQRLGASAGNITASWKGESQPLVPTADGIREPQNRRAEIKVRSKVVEKQ